jgi:hypothetical protein
VNAAEPLRAAGSSLTVLLAPLVSAAVRATSEYVHEKA